MMKSHCALNWKLGNKSDQVNTIDGILKAAPTVRVIQMLNQL